MDPSEAYVSKVTPCLWFDTQAEDAATFYVEAFRACGQEAEIGAVSRYGEAGPGEKGRVLTVAFTLAGQEFTALNGGPLYTFSPAISMMVSCADQAELDAFWDRLSAGGAPGRCGWLTDRFGVSWQVVPRSLGKLLGGAGAGRTDGVMQALMPMDKLDIAALERAARSAERG